MIPVYKLAVREFERCTNRRSQGVQWLHVNPPPSQGGEKNWRGVIYRPQAEQEVKILVIFAGFAGRGELEDGSGVNLAVRLFIEDDDLKVVKKCTAIENPGYVYGCNVAQ